MPEVQAAIIRAIGGITDENSFTLLLEYLNNSNTELVVAALDAIGCTGRESTIPLINPLLNNKNETIRLGAIDCLFRLGVTEVTSRLVAELNKLDANGVVKAVKVSQKMFESITNLQK